MSNFLNTTELSIAMGINKGLISMAVKGNNLIRSEEGLYDIELESNRFWIKKQAGNGYNFDFNRVVAHRANKTVKVVQIGRPKKPPINAVVPKPPKERKVVVIKETLEDRISQESQLSQTSPKTKKQAVKAIVSSGGRIKRENEGDSVNNQFLVKDENDCLREEKLQLEIENLRNRDRLEKLKIAKLEGELLPVDAVKTIFIWAVEEFKKTYEQDCDNIANIFIKILEGEQSHFIEIKKMLMEAQFQIGITYKESLLIGLKNQILEYSDVRSRGERK
jgi:hypothetical protein